MTVLGGLILSRVMMKVLKGEKEKRNIGGKLQRFKNIEVIDLVKLRKMTLTSIF